MSALALRRTSPATLVVLLLAAVLLATEVDGCDDGGVEEYPRVMHSEVSR